jgi:hypothetical protein
MFGIRRFDVLPRHLCRDRGSELLFTLCKAPLVGQDVAVLSNHRVKIRHEVTL